MVKEYKKDPKAYEDKYKEIRAALGGLQKICPRRSWPPFEIMGPLQPTQRNKCVASCVGSWLRKEVAFSTEARRHRESEKGAWYG